MALNNKRVSSRQILANNIRYLRYQNKMSQEDLALKSGINLSFISDIENAKSSASLDTIDDLAIAFDMTSSELIKDHGFIITKKRVDSKN